MFSADRCAAAVAASWCCVGVDPGTGVVEDHGGWWRMVEIMVWKASDCDRQWCFRDLMTWEDFV